MEHKIGTSAGVYANAPCLLAEEISCDQTGKEQQTMDIPHDVSIYGLNSHGTEMNINIQRKYMCSGIRQKIRISTLHLQD